MSKTNGSPVTEDQTFLVAEITKNWTRETPATDLLSSRFEWVINVNHKKGYRLVDWRVNQFVNEDVLTETIFAIFRKREVL